MSWNRRRVLGAAVGAPLGLRVGAAMGADDRGETPRAVSVAELAKVAAAPVLRAEELPAPVTIAAMELLRNGREFLVRVRDRDGVEGMSATNSMHMVYLHPIFVGRIAPFFAGKDARQLEDLLWELYRHADNYKYQGLALWVCVAAAEIAVLDLLGKKAGKPAGELLGGVKRREIAVYTASGTRGNTPEEELADLKKLVAESGAKALKFRLGGRMRRDSADSRPGRSEALIPMVREAFGPDMTLYADSNSSYDAEEAIRIGRIMEKYQYAFYEEPCHFDDLEATRAVAEALAIPVALGEQESSEAGFRRMIAMRAADIVQPDLHYYGGFIRSLRVARMAAAAGMPCTPHMSGSGLGYLDAAHFASLLDNPVPFTEYKGNSAIPISSPTSSLKPEGGIVRIPTGPGFGITIDPAYLHEARPVRAS
ncbi:Putative isomerase YitF [Aquisphaera giovannonii]|uniref:Isomerase YitF n=1 Tax=Aquisphaera giovannonii TaxID=406548 RepID=A0A5B9VT62_9BACT|nr:mandelate racemase/muconate lactonizing enzyme family protein [Aquisphaera giovannonii]QEH31553.1 Putative isomerase YitF [Aquisphaera giovannonii]